MGKERLGVIDYELRFTYYELLFVLGSENEEGKTFGKKRNGIGEVKVLSVSSARYTRGGGD